MLLAILKWALKNTSHSIMRTLVRIFSPILRLLLHITILIMFLNWPAIQCPIKVAYILGICKINFLIPKTEAELMDRHRHTK